MARKTRKNSRTFKLTGIFIILMTMFMAELFFYTWCRVQFVGIGYDISRATNYNQSLTALQNNLKIELASLKSPERLAKIANRQLDLILPAPEQVILIP